MPLQQRRNAPVFRYELCPSGVGDSPSTRSTSEIEHSPSRLAADGVSNSFDIWDLIAYTYFAVETNVPGGAVPPLTSLLEVDRALRARWIMLEKVSDPVLVGRDRE